MSKIQLTKYDQLEELYKGLDGNNELELSNNIKYIHQFDRDWQIIQFICSWARLNKKCYLHLHHEVKLPNIHDRNEMFLIASWVASKVIHNDKDIRLDLLKRFAKFVKGMNGELDEFLRLNKGRKHSFICMEGTRNEFIRHFYIQNAEIFKGKGEIKNFIADMLTKPISSIRKGRFPIEILHGVKQCTFEFFSNTDKHARKDARHPIKSSIRALSFHIYKFSENTIESSLIHSEQYREFLRNHSELLIITIFDNGVGIIKKYYESTTSKNESDISFEDRKKIFAKTFEEGVTSSSKQNSGMGLPYAKSSVQSLRGAYLIHTNSVELFYYPSEDGNYKEEYKEISPRVGTLITVLIPLDDE